MKHVFPLSSLIHISSLIHVASINMYQVPISSLIHVSTLIDISSLCKPYIKYPYLVCIKSDKYQVWYIYLWLAFRKYQVCACINSYTCIKSIHLSHKFKVPISGLKHVSSLYLYKVYTCVKFLYLVWYMYHV